VSLATNELLAVTDKNIQVERATAQGDQYVSLQTQKGLGLSGRYNSLVTAYGSVKANGITINDAKAWKFIFVHYIMAFKLSSPTKRKLLFRNMRGLNSAASLA